METYSLQDHDQNLRRESLQHDESHSSFWVFLVCDEKFNAMRQK